ncbi:hypothetical protein TgHK011_006477 [Trichoderma gracile]|nr:hypothetical protein TgHK011_006477 [Trichoderma gracile]
MQTEPSVWSRSSRQEESSGEQESRRGGNRARNSRVSSRITSVDHGEDAPKRRVKLEWRPQGGVQRVRE